MAAAIQVAGTCLIRTDASGTLADLGYSINGVSIRVVDFKEPVPGDERGGDAGAPIDILHLGTIHIVTLEMSKWDDTIAGYIETMIKAGTAGSTTSGSLYRANTKLFRLLLSSTGFTRNYIGAIPTRMFETDKIGLRYSRKMMQFECHDVAGVLWNGTTS